jgi:hypothetical protein
MTTDYPIEYTLSFVLFWGFALAFEIYAGGLLGFAFTCMAIMIVVSHEHAHAEETLKHGAKVTGIMFTGFGGMVIAEIEYAGDAVKMLLAGIKDTGYYAFSFVSLFLVMTLSGGSLVNGYMFILYPYKDFVAAVAFFAVTLFIMNTIPMAYPTRYGILATDGWAAWMYAELRDEMWNDGKMLADPWSIR